MTGWSLLYRALREAFFVREGFGAGDGVGRPGGEEDASAGVEGVVIVEVAVVLVIDGVGASLGADSDTVGSTAAREAF